MFAGTAFDATENFLSNCVPQINAPVTVHDEMPGVGVERVGQMAGKHRRKSGRSKKIAAIGVATATATALTVGVAPPPKDHAEQLAEGVDLMAAVNPWPAPDQIPDLTGGLGSAAYGFNQAIADVLIRAFVENLNLAALAQAAGLSPDAVLDTLLGGLLGQLPANLLDDIIGQVPIDVSGVVAALLAPLGQAAADLVGSIVAGALPNTLGGLLGLLGLDLSDVLNLSDLNVPGLNIVTAGAPFTLLKMLGADLGWVPGLPNSVANEINNSPYLDLEVGLTDVLGSLPLVGPTVLGLLNGLGITIPDLDVAEVRVSTVVGFGLGAFAAGMAYDQVLADLANQPGGGPTASEHPLLGSITVLPMILLRNPGRANGGLFARFYPLAGLFGIDTVTPETEVSGRGGVPLLNTGLRLGGANVIPVKVDGTVMFDPLSDFAAWPNPFSLANNLMAGVLPTYILRGLTLDTITEQLTSQLDDILDGVLTEPLAINLYLTIPSATLPLLEPLYLLSDVTSLLTLGMGSVNPFSMLANALAPALTSLVNLGYTDVVFNPQTGAYERTLTEAGVPTPFMSFPNVDWGQAVGVILNQLVQGFEKEFFSGNPTAGTPNVITNLLGLLTGGLTGGLGQLGNLGALVQSILEALNPLAATNPLALAEATDVPDPNARMVTMSTTEETDESTTATEDSAVPAEEVPVEAGGRAGRRGTEEVPVDEEVTEEEPVEEEQPAEEETDEEEAGAEEPADQDESTDQKDADEKDADEKVADKPTGPKHAKPDTDDDKPAAQEAAKQTTPKHAKPDDDSNAQDNDNTGSTEKAAA